MSYAELIEENGYVRCESDSEIEDCVRELKEAGYMPAFGFSLSIQNRKTSHAMLTVTKEFGLIRMMRDSYT